MITIPNQELKRIDNDSRGVQSNALAVKILERLSSYYFVIHNLELLAPSREDINTQGKLDNFHNTVCQLISESLLALTECQSSWCKLYPTINALVTDIAIITNTPNGIMLISPQESHKLFFFSQPQKPGLVELEEAQPSLAH